MNVSFSLGNVQIFSKEVLRLSLIDSLGPDGKTKQAAEQRIKALDGMEEHGIHLIDFVLDPNCELAIRELASIMFMKHIKAHWSSSAENFRPPETTFENKNKIKELLLLGLRDSNNKVRNRIAKSVCVIASHDWPENWSRLLFTLVEYLRDGNEISVHGALSVLTKCISDSLTKTRIRYAGSVILEEMYRIVERKDQYSVKIRSKAIGVFTQMITAVSSYGKPDLIEQYSEPLFPKFCKTFIEHLKAENDSKNDNSLKMGIVKAIQVLISRLPKYISEYVPQMVILIWEIFMDIAKVYLENAVNGSNDIIESIHSNAITILEFLAHFINGTEGYELSISDYNFPDYQWSYLLDNYISPEALDYLINLMQITDKQIKVWKSNINLFVFEEELEWDLNHIRNVQRGAEDLLVVIVEHPERAAANSLVVAILKQLEAEKTMRLNGTCKKNKNWWKSHEAYISAFCRAKNLIINRQKAGTLHFDLMAFFEKIVLADLNDPDSHPLLVCRCLRLGGIYSDQMPAKMASRFLKATIEALQEPQLSLARLSAVKASSYWYDRNDSIGGNKENDKVLKSHLPALYVGLHNLGRQLLSNGIVSLVLSSISNLISFDKPFTATVESKICLLAIAAFLKFRNKTEVLDASGSIFRALSQNPECIEPLQTRLVPTLVRLMAAPDSTNEAKDAALDALLILVAHSPQPLSTLLIEKAFPACCECICDTPDPWTLASGSEVIRTYLSEAAQQVIGFQDGSGKTGLQYILQTITHVLTSSLSNVSLIPDYETVILLIKTAGNMLGEDIDQLLTAVLKRMPSTRTNSSEHRSLLIVFAHLINMHLDTVIKFLSTTPETMSQTALALIMSDGFCKEYKYFTRNEDLKIVTLALSRVLGHAVANPDSPLHKITVQADLVISRKIDTETIMKIPRQGATPLLVEISKLITNYLSEIKCEEVESE